MKKLFAFAIAIFAITLFAGCGEKGTNDSGTATIVGKWQFVREVGTEITDGKVTDSWDDNVTADEMFVTFNSDGTGVSTELGETPQSFTYTVSGDKLKLSMDGESMDMEIKKLTKKELAFFSRDDDGDGYVIEVTMYCVRK